MNSSNYAVAVWEGSYNDGVFPLPVFASTRPPGGPWGPVVPVSSLLDEFGNNINPSVYVNEAGTALMTWRVSNNPGRLNSTLVSFLAFGVHGHPLLQFLRQLKQIMIWTIPLILLLMNGVILL